MGNAIEIRGLGKRYRLGTDATGYDTLRDAITRTVVRRRAASGDVWALQDLNLDVPQGQILGIVGDNGAGKTTLLKILARITEPTRREVRVRGRVGALLDVGTGFHPELTGRENVYLSGTILGMRRKEVAALFDEIIEFSGLERFIDTPVKRYSSGMRLRLAFAVAAHIQPAVLVVDEVLAVGDASFRDKCLGRMAEIADQQRTVLFVSHDLGAVSQLCNRAVWIEAGRLHKDSSPGEVVHAYQNAGLRAVFWANPEPSETETVSVSRVALTDADEAQLSQVQWDRGFTIALDLVVRERFPGLDVAILLRNAQGVEIIDATRSDNASLPALAPGSHRFLVDIPPVLASDRYIVAVWVGTRHEDLVMRDFLVFNISPRHDDGTPESPRRRVIVPELGWREHRDELDQDPPGRLSAT